MWILGGAHGAPRAGTRPARPSIRVFWFRIAIYSDFKLIVDLGGVLRAPRAEASAARGAVLALTTVWLL